MTNLVLIYKDGKKEVIEDITTWFLKDGLLSYTEARKRYRPTPSAPLDGVTTLGYIFSDELRGFKIMKIGEDA